MIIFLQFLLLSSMPRPSSILVWTINTLVGAFLIVASAAPKLFMTGPGSPLEGFSRELGVWEIMKPLGVLELVCVILWLIPRTSTVGFVLMVGLLGGAIATDITHTSETAMPAFPVAILLLITVSAYFRNPELLSRLRGKSVAAKA
jgi:hypothetical protein